MAIEGALTPEDQLKVLGRIWGPDRRGYVFLPYIDGHAKDKQERKKGFHEGRAYKWPKEKESILEHIRERSNDDLYFAPNLFNGKRRIEQNVEAERVLYADLDPVNPRGLGELQPTIAWESSPGHYQGVWLLDKPKIGASWGGNENHRLTTLIQADQSGWDSTQLLRVPGRPNYKPEYKDSNNGQPVMADGLLWFNGPRYVWSDFEDLPSVGAVHTDDVEMLDEELIDGVDRHEAWGRVRLKVSPKVREYMAVKTDPEGVADRDQVLWQIERDLADAGCSLVEIIAIVRASVWNKYRGRNDELKRLKIEASKALAARPDDLEVQEVPKPGINWLSNVVQQPIPRPRWLVKDIWTRGGCGFISGAPKSYKSWMALDMAITVATGGYWMNQPGYKVSSPGAVLYLQEEDDLRLVMDRLATITEAKSPERFWRGQMSIVHDHPRDDDQGAYRVVWTPPVAPIPLALHVQTGFVASDPGWQAWLDEMIELGSFDMVLIDTLGTVAGEVDMDRSGELMSQLLKPLKVLAQKHDTAICVVHHNKKASNQGGRAGQDMLGSTALHAWVDCAIYARAKDAHGEIAIEREAKMAMDMSLRIKIPMMFSNIDTGERVLWDPEVITEGLETVQAPEEQPHRREAGTGGKKLAFQMKQMGGGPFTTEELMERLGHDKAGPLRKQLHSGVDNGYIEELSDGWSVIA